MALKFCLLLLFLNVLIITLTFYLFSRFSVESHDFKTSLEPQCHIITAGSRTHSKEALVGPLVACGFSAVGRLEHVAKATSQLIIMEIR